MSIIQISNLTFGYDSSTQNIFENVNLTLDSSWHLGLIGRNGKGKSTFLRLLAQEEFFLGQIQANVDFELYPLKIPNINQTPMAIFQTLCPFQEDWEFLCELNQLDSILSQEVCKRPFSTFSAGERGKIVMAMLFAKPNTFLLLDEPEAHLDFEGRKALIRYLKKKSGFILVSHDRMMLDEVVDHILCLEKSGITLQAGNYSSWQTSKDIQDQSLLHQNESLRQDIKRLQKASLQSQKWAQKAEKKKNLTSRQKNEAKDFLDRGFQGHKAAKIMKRAKSLEKRQEKALEEKKDLLKNIDTIETLRLPTLSFPFQTLLTLKEVLVLYPDHSCPKKPISFCIHQGERIALVGGNGAGKSSLLLAIQDKLFYQGQIIKPKQLVISVVNQDIENLKGSFSQLAQDQNIDFTMFLTLLYKLGFERNIFLQDVSSLSLGQKKKVALALSLCTPAHLYIFDEALNHLDIVSRIQIEKMISQSEATILCVEHDEAFLNHIQAQKIEIEK